MIQKKDAKSISNNSYSKVEKPKTISMEAEEMVDVNDIGPDILKTKSKKQYLT